MCGDLRCGRGHDRARLYGGDGDVGGFALWAIVSLGAIAAIAGAVGGASGALVVRPLWLSAIVAAAATAAMFLVIEMTFPLIEPMPSVLALMLGAAAAATVLVTERLWRPTNAPSHPRPPSGL